jgi:20S proteasome alpha/beta subunit
MTTIIGIKCKDGIVLASDSQATSPIMKNMQVSKIFQINHNIGIGTSGSEPSIKVLVESLQQSITLEDLESEQKLKEKTESILLELHRYYNVERSRKLGFDQKNIQLSFIVDALVGAKLSNDEFCLLHIMQNGWIDKVNTYRAIGSGFPLANLVFTQQNRIPMMEGKSISDLEINYNIWIASYVINEVKAVEPYTGGNTRIVVIGDEGFQEIPDKIQHDFYENTITAISKVMEEKLSDSENKTNFKTIFPKN